jgi:hypothetical protein
MGLLFSDGQLSDYLHSHDIALHDEVEATPDEHILQADVDGWAEALADAYAVQAPEIRREDLWGDEPQSGRFDVRFDSASRLIIDPSHPMLVPGTFVRVHVPFDGDDRPFLLTASAMSWNPPEAEVMPGELIFEAPATYTEAVGFEPHAEVCDECARFRGARYHGEACTALEAIGFGIAAARRAEMTDEQIRESIELIFTDPEEDQDYPVRAGVLPREGNQYRPWLRVFRPLKIDGAVA